MGLALQGQGQTRGKQGGPASWTLDLEDVLNGQDQGNVEDIDVRANRGRGRERLEDKSDG